MSIFQSVVLGIVQGLTEFLPVSSSGHLVLFSKLPFWPEQPLVFDTTLHLATALTLIVYFFSDLKKIALTFVKDAFTHVFAFRKYSQDARLGLFMLFGSIPAGTLGFLFENDFETRFRSVESVMVFLFLGAVLMLIAQKYGMQSKSLESLDVPKSIKIGLFQSLALLPGMSRSGATISGALFQGLRQYDAARFSFLMSIPIVVLAGLYKLLSTDWATVGIEFSALSAGFITSFVSGLLVVHFLLNYLKTKNLNIFIVYRMLLLIALFFLR
jgi:undecaprenyl-diphosphatase